MALWYFHDKDGQKQGPYSGGQLRWYVKQGEITPDTFIENEDGKSVPAREVKGLTFSETETYGLTPSPPPLVEENPFAAPMPAEKNPFAVSLPVVTHPLPQNIALPVAQGNTGSFWRTIVRTFKILIVLLILSAAVVTVGPILWESQKLSTAAKKFIEDVFTDRPLKVAGFSVKWTNKPSYVEIVTTFWSNLLNFEDIPVSYASGTFSVDAKVTEKLYRSVSIEEGLRELGITDLHENELNEAMEKLCDLPMAYQNDLRKTLPKDMPALQFYKVFVPEGENEILTGSIELTKNNKDWQEESTQVDPYSFEDDFIPDSNLIQDANRLDDPVTTTVVQSIIRNRSDFAAKVNEAITDLKKRDEISVTSIKTELADPSLEEFGNSDISVRWVTETSVFASGMFTAKTRTKEKLYQFIDNEDGLRELGITVTYEREFDAAREKIKSLPEPHKTNLTKSAGAVSELSGLPFYHVRAPKGEEVTRTGSIELTKTDNKGWQVKVRSGSSDNFTPESKLGAEANKLDDRKTKETVVAIIRDRKNFVERLRPIYDFDEFCKPGKLYEGNFPAGNGHCDVEVVFSGFDRNTISAKGTITFQPGKAPANWKYKRGFTVDVHIGGIDHPVVTVTGIIDNRELPARGPFVQGLVGDRGGPDREDARLFHTLLDNFVDFSVRFTDNEMQWSIDRKAGDPIPGLPASLEAKFPIPK